MPVDVCVAKYTRYYTIAHAQGGSRTTPYTIEMNLYKIVDGKEVLDYPAVYSQTSAGLQSHLSYAGGSTAWGEVGRVIRYPDGGSVTLYDKMKVKSVHTPDPPIDLKTRAALNSLPCDKLQTHGTTKLRDETFLGYPVTVVLLQSRDNIRTTHWRAPAFGCMSLKYTVERLGNNGAWATTYEGWASSARLGEPDARMFDLGDTYEVVTDAEAEKRLAASAEKFQPGSTAH